MSRKISCNLLLERASQEVVEIQARLPKIAERDSFNRIIVGIKVTLEQLRSVLDYMSKDIVDILPSKPSGNIYFPFVHPRKKDGTSLIRADIHSEFKKTYSYLDQLSSAHSSLYKKIEDWQGEQWISDLINAVNPQKHDDLASLGEPVVRFAPNIAIKGSGAFVRFEAGANVNGETIQDTRQVIIGEPVPESLSHLMYESVEVDMSTFNSEWVNKLDDWTQKIKVLVDSVYQHIS